ncbi:uncharacterized protein METZ01_LOCUS281377 [marine metagenome]|uniref:Uncharacterized protein n=1 Tax=marine metagenome TaxID=408172 RepID=A0A382KYC6_9ZZZZ
MSGHGQHSVEESNSRGRRAGGCRTVGGRGGVGVANRRSVSKKPKYVLRARNYIDVNYPN